MAKFLETILKLGAGRKYVGHLGRRDHWTDQLVEIELTHEEADLVDSAFERGKDRCHIDTAARLFPHKVRLHR